MNWISNLPRKGTIAIRAAIWTVLVISMAGHFSTMSSQESCLDFELDKAGKILKKAQESARYSREERLKMLDQAFEKDEMCMGCLLESGRIRFQEIKRTGGSFEKARFALRVLTETCPKYNAEPYYILGAMAYADREYEDAKLYFEQFLHFPAEPESALGKRYDKHAEEIHEVLPLIHFELDFWARDDTFQPQVIEPISQSEDEYLPAISPDGTLLFFTRRGKYKAKGDVVSQDLELFCMAHFTEETGIFSEDEALEAPFNRARGYGGASISVNNLELYIAVQNPTNEAPDNVDIFMTHYNVLDRESDGSFIYIWGALRPVEGINTVDGWESQPSLSADGNELFFATINRFSTPDRSGNPTMDIWTSKRSQGGSWLPPKTIPFAINSEFNEKAPFLHPDGKTLYFASDRSPGGGGYDIWFSQRDKEGVWGEPRNIGAPINTSGDEHGLIVSTDGKSGYFSSRRKGTLGLDILQFPLPEAFAPEKVTVVKGQVTLSNGKIPVDAQVFLQYGAAEKLEKLQINLEDGRFASVINLSGKEDILLIAQGEGLAFEAQVIVDKERHIEPNSNIQAHIELEQPENGEAFEIGDIQFESSSAAINRTSMLMLQSFAQYLIHNQAIGVHVIGHTDNAGPKLANQLLSEQRAQAVARAMAKFGVKGPRIRATGMGESNPVVPNDNSENRAKNRRTEFEIVLKNH